MSNAEIRMAIETALTLIISFSRWVEYLLPVVRRMNSVNRAKNSQPTDIKYSPRLGGIPVIWCQISVQAMMQDIKALFSGLFIGVSYGFQVDTGDPNGIDTALY